MPSYKRMFASKTLRADGLSTYRPQVVISEVIEEEIADHVQKLVAYFDVDKTTFVGTKPSAPEERQIRKELTKGWVLNQTNCATIAEIAKSDDDQDWVGTAVVLYATTTDFQGKRVACIRCEAPSKTKRSTKATPPTIADADDEEEAPF